jgi:hypothetical protein
MPVKQPNPQAGPQSNDGIRTDKRPRVYECYWAHFAAEIHLDE